MTKKAFFIICLLIIIPIALTAWLVVRYFNGNPVVAKFGGDVQTIMFRGRELHAVPGDDTYLFRFGTYLGKVGDKITGPSLYRVRDDKTGGYFAIADGERSVLFTMTGTLIDGLPTDADGNPSTVTRVIVNDYYFYSEADVRISDFVDFEHAGATVEFKPSEFVRKAEDDEEEDEVLYTVYRIRYCFNGSAVSRRTSGRLFYFTETKSWIYVDEEKYAAAVAEYGEKSEALVLAGFRVEDSQRAVNLRAALVSNRADTTETQESVETIAPSAE